MTILYTEPPAKHEIFANKYRLILSEISKQLSVKIIEENIDIKMLADEVGVSPQTILDCVKGDNYQCDVLFRLAYFLDCNFLKDVNIQYSPGNGNY